MSKNPSVAELSRSPTYVSDDICPMPKREATRVVPNRAPNRMMFGAGCDFNGFLPVMLDKLIACSLLYDHIANPMAGKAVC